jgi:Protein of unknown function (DUF1592)/Protein of unknown function (DUF1588)
VSRLGVILSFALTASCQGTFFSASGKNGSAENAAAQQGALEAAFECTDENRELRGLHFDNTRRLSRAELILTLRDLLGSSVASDATIAGRLDGLPADDTVSAGDFTSDPPAVLASVLADVAKRAVPLMLANAEWRATVLPACAATMLDDACVERVIRSYGAKIWRRDLDDQTVTELLAFQRELGGGEQGLSFLLRRMLQSPTLVFHVEASVPFGGGRAKVDAFTVASRIAYMVTGAMPDEALMTAAREGALDTLEGVRAQVARLTETPRAREKVRDFLRFYAKLDVVSDPALAAAKNVGIANPTGLGEEMRRETVEFFEHVFWEKSGTFSELMSSTDAFPRSSALASILQTPQASAGPVTAASHKGLLHRPAMLASAGPRTSPIVRGAHLRKLFLCDELRMPDVAIVNARQQEIGDIENMTNREKVTALTNAPQCTACHGMINDVGFSFEGYDQLGRRRASESIYDDAGGVAKTWPLDTHVQKAIVDWKPHEVASSAELTDIIAASVQGRACMTRRMFEYFRLSTADVVKDGCALAEAEAQTASAPLRDVFVSLVANEDIFYKADAP